MDFPGGRGPGDNGAVTDKKSPVEQALDLFVYAPLGLLFNVREIVPELVEKGRQQVLTARVFGQYAVEHEAPKLLAQLQAQAGRRAHRPAPARGSAAAPS